MCSTINKKLLKNRFALAVVCLCLWQAHQASAQSPAQDIMVINFPVQGWYLLSLPLTVADSSVSALFPTALGIFAWDNVNSRYVQPTALQTGRGYWVLMAAPTAVAISGKRFSQYRRHYLPGWHLIGSLIDSISFADPDDTPNNSVLLPTFAWHAGEQNYYATTAIEQSYGQWMAVFQECEVTVKPASTMMPVMPMVQRAGKGSDKFSRQTFYRRFGAMPPPPFLAGQALEAKLATNFRQAYNDSLFLASFDVSEALQISPAIDESAPRREPLMERAGQIALQINTVPVHCSVIVDDKLVGQSPLTVYVDRRSSHVVQIFRDGYEEKIKVLDWRFFGDEAVYLLIEKLAPKR